MSQISSPDRRVSPSVAPESGPVGNAPPDKAGSGTDAGRTQVGTDAYEGAPRSKTYGSNAYGASASVARTQGTVKPTTAAPAERPTVGVAANDPSFDSKLHAKMDPQTFEIWSALSAWFSPTRDQHSQGPLADPNAMSKDVGFVTDTVDQNQELFGAKGPQDTDVQQGYAGDCFFLATLSAEALEDPKAIRDNIRPTDDPHVYEVRFYYKDPATGKTGEEWVPVDDALYREKDGTETYAQTKDADGDGHDEMWVALYEKAFASFAQEHAIIAGSQGTGYDAIGNGGYGDEAFFALTGKDAGFDEINKADQNGNFTGPGSMQGAPLWELLSGVNANPPEAVTIATGGSGGDTTDIAPGIPANHMYTVVDTFLDPTTGEQMVTLRNPWGASPGGDYLGADHDGLFTIPFSQLQNIAAWAVTGDSSGSNASGSNVGSGSGVGSSPSVGSDTLPMMTVAQMFPRPPRG